MFTDVRNVNRKHGPCSRAVNITVNKGVIFRHPCSYIVVSEYKS